MPKIEIIKFFGHTNHVISREGNQLEFKESFNWNSKDKYARSVAAFANNRGGHLIFGVKNKPREIVGLLSQNFEEIDEAKFTQYFNSVFSPEIQFEKIIKERRGLKIGILKIYQVYQKPIISIKNDGEIKEGEIYYRYNARSEKVKFPESFLKLYFFFSIVLAISKIFSISFLLKDST